MRTAKKHPQDAPARARVPRSGSATLGAWLLSLGLAALASCAAPAVPPPVTAAPAPAPSSPVTAPVATSSAAPAPSPPAEPSPPELKFPDEAFRAKRPGAGPARAFKTPTIDRFKLKGGVEVFLVERHELPLVALNLTFEGGALLDPKGKEGMASLCAQLLTDGTQKLDKLALEEALADIASEVSSGAAADQHFVALSALRPHLDTTLDLWADAMLRPGLRPDELAAHRRPATDEGQPAGDRRPSDGSRGVRPRAPARPLRHRGVLREHRHRRLQGVCVHVAAPAGRAPLRRG
jgi:hypothetical protein